MQQDLKRSALATIAIATGGLVLSACAGPMWTATHGDVQQHVTRESEQRQAADAETRARVASVDQAAQDALARATAAGEAAKHPFARSVLMSDDSVKFDTNKSDLSPEAQAVLTSFAEKLKSENKNVYIEIQGHGDVRGSAEHNKALGAKRAEAVREFLSAQGVPLDRMSIISFGEEQPKNSQTGAAANAENRRVVLIVMG